MHIRMSETFREERERYRLEFTCEECANWHAEREACSILYPADPHREHTVAATPDGERVYFCKMWEAA